MGVGGEGASGRIVCGLQVLAIAVVVVARGADGDVGGGSKEFGKDWRQEATARLLPVDEVAG